MARALLAAIKRSTALFTQIYSYNKRIKKAIAKIRCLKETPINRTELKYYPQLLIQLLEAKLKFPYA